MAAARAEALHRERYIALSGGRIEQTPLGLVCKYGEPRNKGGTCNFGVDIWNAAKRKAWGVTEY